MQHRLKSLLVISFGMLHAARGLLLPRGGVTAKYLRGRGATRLGTSLGQQFSDVHGELFRLLSQMFHGSKIVTLGSAVLLFRGE